MTPSPRRVPDAGRRTTNAESLEKETARELAFHPIFGVPAEKPGVQSHLSSFSVGNLQSIVPTI